jgi:hypothetical protein
MGGGATFRGKSTVRWPVGVGGIRYVECEPSQAAAKARLRAELRAALPVYGWMLVDEPRSGAPAPLLYVGTKDRPDVRDYLRVHRLDSPPPGEGDAWSQVYAVTGTPIGAPVLFVHVRTMAPARCDFTVALRFGRHDAALAALATSGVLAIAVDPFRVRCGAIQTPAVMFQVSGRELVRTLVRAWVRVGVCR